MPSHNPDLEIKVKNGLQGHGSIKPILKQLNSSNWKKAPLVELRPYLFLLLHLGQWKTIIEISIMRIFNEEPICWDILAESLASGVKKIDLKIVKTFYLIANQNNKLHEFNGSPALDQYNKRFKKNRQDIRDKNWIEYFAQKRFWIEEVRSLQMQRLYKKSNETIKKLESLYPNDHDIQYLKKSTEEVKAKETIERLKSQLTFQNLSKIKRVIQSKDIKNEISSLFQTVKTTFKTLSKENTTNKTIAYDFALMFYFFESPEKAIQLLNEHPESEKKFWLLLELYLEARHYLDALEYIRVMEFNQIQIEDPETTFALQYAKAKAYYGLGQTSEALEILEQIMEYRPYYRSTQSLFLQWSRE